MNKDCVSRGEFKIYMSVSWTTSLKYYHSYLEKVNKKSSESLSVNDIAMIDKIPASVVIKTIEDRKNIWITRKQLKNILQCAHTTSLKKYYEFLNVVKKSNDQLLTTFDIEGIDDIKTWIFDKKNKRFDVFKNV